MNKCRCDERLQTKTKEFTRLPYTGLVLELLATSFFRETSPFLRNRNQSLTSHFLGTKCTDALWRYRRSLWSAFPFLPPSSSHLHYHVALRRMVPTLPPTLPSLFARPVLPPWCFPWCRWTRECPRDKRPLRRVNDRWMSGFHSLLIGEKIVRNHLNSHEYMYVTL
jgi:hypothetical protein